MDPDVAAFLAVVNGANQPPIDAIPIAEVRRQFAGLAPVFHPHVEVTRVTNLQTAAGIPLRSYRPLDAGDDLLPAIVYFHGGGWVMGDLDTHDTLCRQLANASGAVVVAVDYRLAPEHPFPAAFEDSLAAVLHVFENAAEFGIDPQRIAVAGDSAGGNLAAAVCLHARDNNGPNIAAQCLLYPVLDAGCATQSYESFADGYGLTRAKMQFFWKSYLRDHAPDHPHAVPAAAADLGNLPPAIILTAGYDVLGSEAEHFGERLASAGVAVEMIRCEGVIHGFIHFAGAIRQGQTVLREVAGKLAARLTPEIPAPTR